MLGRGRLVLAIALAAPLLLSGCGGKDEATSDGSEPAAASDTVAAGSIAEPVPAASPVSEPAEPPAAEAASAIAPAEAASTPPPESPGSAGPGASAPVAEASAATPAADAAITDGEQPNEPSPLALGDVTIDPEMLAMIEAGDPIAGRLRASRCTGCHALDRGGEAHAAAQVGPSLYNIFGTDIGAVTGFDYSLAFAAVHDSGAVWTVANLNAFLSDPEAAIPGTAMTIGGIPDAQDRANVIAFLRILADEPLPFTGGEEAAPVMGDPELLARIAGADPDRGQGLVARCSGCHRFGEGDPPLTGPNLYDVVGQLVGAKQSFRYSQAFIDLNAEGAVWTYERLDAFLANPAVAIPGTRMGFSGVAGPNDRAAIIAYLRTLAPEPFPLVVEGPTNIGVVREGLDPLTYTAAEADAGADIYADTCSRCHAADLHGEIDLGSGGFGVVPPLIGPNFEGRWFTGNIDALFNVISRTMPPTARGTLDDQTVAEIVAYILARNGFAPGPTELPTDREVLANMGFFQQ